LATYTGSPEHKFPHLRNDATPCPPDLEENQQELTDWVKNGILKGYCGGLMEGAFPRYIWHREGDRFFEGRLTNQARGEYKGYPIDPDEAPPELRADHD
jgi:hypothetical protein